MIMVQKITASSQKKVTVGQTNTIMKRQKNIKLKTEIIEKKEFHNQIRG